MLDLHIHSTASDGTCAPAQIVRMAGKKGFSLIAITDHDTMDGVNEAIEAGKSCNVDVIAGVEISSGIELEVHMLGYGMSPEHPAIKQLLTDMRIARVERMYKIIENLNALGIPIDAREVEALADGAIGRPHIARVMVAHGVSPDVRSAFRDYIGVGARAYAERRKLTSRQVIRCIRQAGGIPVLAHGGLLKLTQPELLSWIDAMCTAGLMGLECYHNAHTPMMERFLRKAAQERGLLVTGGSDFHGETRPDVDLGSGLERWEDRQSCRGRFLQALADVKSASDTGFA